MGILVRQRLGDGSLADIDSDVLSVARRLQEGDGTLGWEGCPELSLRWDEESHEFVVVHEPLGAEPYVVCRHHRCDAELIRKVVMADGRRQDVFGRVEAERTAVERERDRQWNDWLDNHIVPKSRWAFQRDDGWRGGGANVWMGGRRGR